MRARSLASVVTVVVAAVAPIARVSAASLGPVAAATLRPNLVTLPFGELSIEREAGIKLLRFSNTVGNRGPGVLELFPVADDCDADGDPLDDRSAFQRLFADSNANGVFDRGVDDVAAERFTGCMLFHPEHDHWHLEDFARYVLTKPKDGRIVASADKVSFCVRDSLPEWPDLPGTPSEAFYGECTQDAAMGMSVGWADVYAAELAGQSLDITGLPNGRYCLMSVVDPFRHIRERRDDDNRRRRLIRIHGPSVVALSGSCDR